MAQIKLQTTTPLQDSLVRIQNSLNSLQSQMVAQTTLIFKYIWLNPDQVNCSPDKMIAALGKNAVTLISGSSNIQTLLNAASPGTINLSIPTGWTLTPATDGSAVATYAAPTS